MRKTFRSANAGMFHVSRMSLTYPSYYEFYIVFTLDGVELRQPTTGGSSYDTDKALPPPFTDHELQVSTRYLDRASCNSSPSYGRFEIAYVRPQ